MAHMDEEVGWLASRVDEFAQRFRHVATGEVQSLSRSIADRRQREGESRDLLATAFALSREALQRTAGIQVDAEVVNAVSAAMAGLVPVVTRWKNRQAALAMATYWHSVAGKGVHFLTWDEKAAKDSLRLFEPVGLSLGCEARLVTQPMSSSARRSAYGAAVTFGSYSEMAADYLRDNLSDKGAEVVQRGLFAAVVDGVDSKLVRRALSHVLITAPRRDNPIPSFDAEDIASSFKRGLEYRVDRERRSVILSTPGMARLKLAVGWAGAPSTNAVSLASRVEDAIMAREGLAGANDRETIAEISVQGYLGAYERVTGISSTGRTAVSFDDILRRGGRSMPSLSELTFERLIDRQRGKIYAYRAEIRGAPDTLSLLRPLVTEAIRTWQARGVEILIAGLSDVLAGFLPRGEIVGILRGHQESDCAMRAASVLDNAVEQRVHELGAPQAADLLLDVLLPVIDMEWRDHINRVRFVQRQSGALYGMNADIDATRGTDIETLFAGCEQAIRAESIKYFLNVTL